MNRALIGTYRVTRNVDITVVIQELSVAFCVAFAQRRRNLRKSLLKTTRPTGIKRAEKWLR